MDGAYNFRIIQYANGSVEIRKYSSPVNAIYEGETTIEPIYQKPKIRNPPKEYNPFTDENAGIENFNIKSGNFGTPKENERSARKKRFLRKIQALEVYAVA